MNWHRMPVLALLGCTAATGNRGRTAAGVEASRGCRPSLRLHGAVFYRCRPGIDLP